MPSPLENARRVVIKLGTGILTSGIGNLNTLRIQDLCKQIAAWRAKGLEILVVSSGAVGLGMGRLGLKKKPSRLSALQMCAAVGQSKLIETWQTCLDPYKVTVAQLLLTREDVTSRERHVAAKNLLDEMLAEGIVPIINENDSISDAELKFGDNDVLSALVASMSKADALVILSTAPGVVDREGSGKIIPVIEAITPRIRALAGGSESATGTGGMITKIEAADMATKSGCSVFIGSGEDPTILDHLIQGTAVGTYFLPSEENMQSRKRWLAFFHNPEGTVIVDAGAEEALRKKGSSLLAKGVASCSGNFSKGDIVFIANSENQPFAQGVIEYSAKELNSIKGLRSSAIREKFGNRKHVEVIHRDSLAML